MLKQYKLRNYHFQLILYISILTIIGILLIGSAEPSVQKKQIIGFVIGIVMMIVISLMDYSFLLKRPEPFARAMFGEFATRGLKPVVIVDYLREAYTFPTEDVRITFDKDIRTAYRGVSLFDFDQPTYPVIDDYAMVMEVKFNAYLPTWIRELIQPVSNIRSAISKYCLCRKYEF